MTTVTAIRSDMDSLAISRTTFHTYGSGRAPRWLQIDWSAHLRWLEIRGRMVNVLDVGEGPAILFVHGHNVCWQHWLEQIDAFKDTHRVIALDLPGFGHSELPAGEVSIPGYAQTLADVLDALEIETATVVANSMGGAIAAEMAISFADRVSRLVLISPAGLSDRYLGLPASLIRHPFGAAVGRGLFAVPPPEPVLRALARRPRGRTAALGVLNGRPAYKASELHPALVYEVLCGASRPAASAAAVALAKHDLRAKLPEVAAPTLIVWGDRDKLIPLRCAHEFDRLIPDSRLLVYGETGHNAMIERPLRFNADLAAFIGERAFAVSDLPIAKAA
jgi:pimeloyl-ACP methyl ester carboxylesterase